MAREDSPRLTPAENRKFAVVVGIAFLALGGVALWQEHRAVTYGAVFTGGVLLLVGWWIPDRLGPVHRAWMGAASAISRVTTPVVMGLLYLMVITPAGIVLRLLGYDPIQREDDQESFWVDREEDDGIDLHRQF